MNAVVILVSVAATLFAGVRWLRVAQREHYLPGRASRFAARWWFGSGPNALLAVAVAVGLAGATSRAVPGLVAAAAVATGPLGLSVRGRTGRLAWTRRLRTLAGVWVGLQAVLIVVAAATAMPAVAVFGAVFVPPMVDLAAAITAPIERRLAARFVEAAAKRAQQVAPVIVAITGSYGKTSTKGFVAHFVGPYRTVVASPRSFNNRAGLARAVNEHLAPGTDVFVAEMGTYGKGEIAELCGWLPPKIAAITAIGPVHLERFGSEDAIVEAKSEILDRADVAVLNIDDPRLAALAGRRAAMGQRVVRCSAVDPAADVAVLIEGDGSSVVLSTGGVRGPAVPRPVAPLTNVAVAAAIALELGVSAADIAGLVPSVPAAANRATVGRGANGFTIIDDTFNSNPAGAAHALDLLRREAAEGARAVVVTPGMVELGPRQAEENEKLARAAGEFVTDFVIVGQTNRRALARGLRDIAGVNVVLVDHREEAVEWVKAHLNTGDAVLYENDLPDHFP